MPWADEMRGRSWLVPGAVPPARPKRAREEARPAPPAGGFADELVGREQLVALPDRREQEAWFRQLDEHAQEVVRERWRAETRETAHDRRRFARTRRQELAEGAGTLAFVQVVTLSAVTAAAPGWWPAQIVLAALAGSALGALWRAIDAGVVRCILTAMGSSFALQLTFVVAGWLPWPALVIGPWLAGFVGRLAGVRREEIPGS